MEKSIPAQWWQSARAHSRPLDSSSPILTDRSDLAPAIEFMANALDLPQGARILDLCCGPGRYAVELARRGFEVLGIDINEHFVALARELTVREGVSADFIQGDMRETPRADYFDAVINVGTSFGLFEDGADDRKVLFEVARALKPGSLFLLETGNREWLLKHFTAAESRDNDDGTTTDINRQFDYTRSRIVCTFRQSGGGQVPVEWYHSWRAYTLAEICGMLGDAHLEVEASYGGWEREAYDVDSHRMVVVSRKRI